MTCDDCGSSLSDDDPARRCRGCDESRWRERQEVDWSGYMESEIARMEQAIAT